MGLILGGLQSGVSSAASIIASLAGQAISALSYTATQISGSDAFAVSNNGARVHFGAGASDYASSNGTTVTFAGPVAVTGAFSGATSITNSGASGNLPVAGTLSLATGKPLYFVAGLNVYVYGTTAGNVLIPSSTSDTLEVLVGGTATVDTTVNGSGADTTEDNLTSYAVPAGAVAVNGRGLRVTAWGDGVSTADVTTIKGYFGATAVVTKVLTASQANTWRAEFEVVRTAATTQVATGCLFNGGTAATLVQSNSSPAETLANAITIKFTGQRTVSSVANSLRQLGLVVEFF